MMVQLGNLGFQYVILENEFDYTEITFNDILEYDNVYYYRYPLNVSSKILKNLYVLHGAQKINQIVSLPAQSIWNSLLYNDDELNHSKPTCFIYSFRRIDRLMRSGFFDSVKNKFPKTFHVAYWDDLVRPNHLDSLKYALDKFDLVFSYDEGDANRYGMRYYPSFYSKYIRDSKVIPQYDVFFIGNAKDRLTRIYQTYDFLVSNGLNCRFIINGINGSDKRRGDGIIYNHPLTYKEVLSNVLMSKSILEIIQQGSRGQTLRVNEAVCYQKKLLSNNPAIQELPQFDNRYMHIFSDVPILKDVSFIQKNDDIKYTYPLEKLSPVRFIETIERLLGDS